jgi:crossover junction endodeoxyribonuclease RuvC
LVSKAPTSTTILGLDPGLARMGYGVIRQDGNRFRAIAYGTIETTPDRDHALRLVLLFDALRDIVRKQRPDVVAVEELFFSKNVKTAMGVAQARGVALKPGQIKQAVTGYGSAEKGQVQRMVKLLLGLKEVPQPDDTADALAVAIAHAQGNPAIWTPGGR